MKKILLIIALIGFAFFGKAQETTVEVLDIVSQSVDTIFCKTDTLTTIYLQVLKTTTENGTDYPDVSIDTTLIKSGICPSDSLEVLRQISRDALEIQNRASHTMNLAFARAKRDQAVYQDVRTVYNNFSGSDLYISNENRFWSDYTGRYRIIDVQASTNVTAELIRVGASDRYRLEIEDGEPGAGTRYAVIPLSRNSFQVNNWNGDNYKMYLDKGVDNRNPVYREPGYLKGGADDKLRVIKIK
jgi:hypothetical protein